MKGPISWIDSLGYWIAKRWTPILQVRVGTLSTIAGLLLIPVGFISGEPILIYMMSAFALVLAGLGVLVTAVLAVKEDPDSSEEDLKPE